MAKAKADEGKAKRKRTTKRDVWMAYYLDHSNPETYLNATASAKAAGYKAKSEGSFQAIGCENLRKLQPKIQSYLVAAGLTEENIKKGIVEGMAAHETVFFQKDGKVTEARTVIPWGVRLGYLRLAAQMQGMLINKHEVTGEGGGPVVVYHKSAPRPEDGK